MWDSYSFPLHRSVCLAPPRGSASSPPPASPVVSVASASHHPGSCPSPEGRSSVCSAVVTD
ncbi:hypothetical protein PIB30_020968 [Stylosanthes scabra]|uniref:Uncharacterized protein n=1 Tax=Stylosanthes scabra TaxID=79078 RepID=A0ABU6S8X8_9FABA|nr:hypothetical protein [Stylosanthes scabra]